MGVESNVEYLIVDTSAFIKNAALQEIGNKIITEPSVVDEIKSKRQLRRLIVLPYDLEVKEAYPEDIKFVTEFAKKTGDYISLSATDIKVIALTYRYEKERVGTDHLRQEPEKKKEIVDSSVHKPDDNNKNLIGFYLPEGEEEDDQVNDNKSETKASNEETKDKPRNVSESSSTSSVDNQHLVTANDISKESESESDYETAQSDEGNSQVDDLSKKFKKLECNPEDLKVECGDDLTIDDILKPMKKDTCEKDDGHDSGSHDEEEEDDNDDDDDDDDEDCSEDDSGWITPKNITNIKKQMDSDVIKEKPATVACLTMDYAMQNVLLQIGLNVASLEGKCIKQMRTFILRCYTCFKTTGVVTKLFCPHCGNKTLKKVAVSVDDEGKQIIHINFRKPLTSRGKKFSLPTFQGGKHACNPILFEDQPIPDQKPSKLGSAKNDPLKEDYIAGYSPFVMRDVNSRAAMLGIKSGSPMKHWMRRNPNEVRKTR
ncbi:hypothetical protein TSAR_002607, partial [Trichomalopsis sarcophagae]